MEDENIVRILVASDIHLGYKEKDSTQEKDSFNSFEEVFAIAKERNADFVLLGGDLFHENKPSRKALHTCMEIMRRYCLGDSPCAVEVLSDQSVNFGHTSRTVTTVNYEDPNINISMPVFSIHGNHDDPAGAGSLSAIDLLSVAGYLNHFGRTTSLDSIAITPVLLRKGSTKIALYGLGSVRDERLHRMFLKKNVKFLRPKETTNEWFNIMTIHQNRVKHGPTNYIPEEFLENFLDLVVWGHEHESVGKLEYNNIQNFCVLQPGSTVATSLSHGESKKKQVTLLEVCGDKMKHEFIELRTVRNMYVEDIVLKDIECIPAPSVPTIEDEIQAYCREKVELILEKAERELSGHPKQPTIPLIRLRIDHSGGYPVFNSYRLGAHFAGKVANPDSIIHFLKKSASRVKSEMQDMKDFDDLIVPEVVEKVKMEDFVEDFLIKERSLAVLSARGMKFAVQEFVEKKEKDAIYDLCHYQLKKIQDHIKKKCPNALEDNEITQEIERYKEERKAKHALEAENAVVYSDDEETVEALLTRVKQERSALGIPGPTANIDSDENSSKISDSEQEVPAGTKRSTRGRGSRGGTRGRGRGRGSRGSRGGKASKAAIPVVETTASRSTIMDAFASQKMKHKSPSAMVMEISDTEDDSEQSTSSRTKKSSSKRARGVQYESDDDNPFSNAINRKKKR